MNNLDNTGHGHVFPRPDGVRSRCGGPPFCKACTADLAKKRQQEALVTNEQHRGTLFGQLVGDGLEYQVTSWFDGFALYHQLAPLPAHPEGGFWTTDEIRAIREYGRECIRRATSAEPASRDQEKT